MRTFFRQPFTDALAALEPIMRHRRGFALLMAMMAGLVVTWFLYVPVHELLHVAGCVLPGGSVSELEIKSYYGGHLLARYFDFVTVGGQYGGRLSGFDTNGSDLIYLSTVFLPFVPSVLFGVPLLWICTRRRRVFLAGPAFVLAFAPFFNLPGDYYEIASILTTRLLTILISPGGAILFEGMRSDDIFTLATTLVARPAELGLESWAAVLAGGLIFAVSLALAVWLAFLTYWMGAQVGRVTVGMPRAPSVRSPRRPRRRPSSAPSADKPAEEPVA